MNKWFEKSTNFASYAKVALKEAQKRIDQVLDIKEEDIINNVLAQPSSLSSASLINQDTNNFFNNEYTAQNQPQSQISLTLSNTSQPRTIRGDDEPEDDNKNESFNVTDMKKNEEKNEWIQNHWNNDEQDSSNKESEIENQSSNEMEEVEDAMDEENSSQQKLIESTKIDDFVQVNCNESQNSDERETNFSSDIEVLSLTSSKILALTATSTATTTTSMHTSNVILVKSPPATTHEQSVIEQREAQVLKLNKQNVQLQEQNDNLKSEIERLRSSVQEEINAQLRDKNEQIEQLTQEGLKLSKNELNQSNIIKKLRAKDKENDETIKKLNEELKNSIAELDELRKILDGKESNEKIADETVKKLEKAVLSYEKEIKALKIVNDEYEEKITSMKNTLDNSYKEIAELQKANATKQNQINVATNSLENQFKEELEVALEKERFQANKKQEALKWELQNVRSDIMRLEQQHGLREDMLKKEISTLQQQLRDADIRSNEHTQNITNCTKPLLRQIENLQVSHQSQMVLLENAEKNLIEKLKEAQNQLCKLTEKDRQQCELIDELNQKLKSCEHQIQAQKLEKSKLSAELDETKSKIDSLESDLYNKEAQLDLKIVSLNKKIDSLTKDNTRLECELQCSRQKNEQDTRKLKSLVTEYSKDKVTQQVVSSSQAPQLKPQIQVYDYLRQSNTNGALNILENLQSKLQEKDGEIAQLLKNINDLERIRESLAKELVNLSNKVDKLEDQLKGYPQLEENHKKLNQDYTALLQMYGEKEEEADELRMDLCDVKDMYKIQIEDLLRRLK